MTHEYARHAAFIHVTWLIHMAGREDCVVSCVCVACATWRIHTCDMMLCMWRDTFTCVTWLIYMVGLADCIESWVCVTWLRHTCGMTPSYVWTWLIHVCDMTESYTWHNAFIRATLLLHTRDKSNSDGWVRRLRHVLRMCDMTHSYVWHDSFIQSVWRIHMCHVT